MIMKNFIDYRDAFFSVLENDALIQWDFMSDSEKSIYKNKHEFAEVSIREFIHKTAVEYGLMK